MNNLISILFARYEEDTSVFLGRIPFSNAAKNVMISVFIWCFLLVGG